jgi:hypothetical protein
LDLQEVKVKVQPYSNMLLLYFLGNLIDKCLLEILHRRHGCSVYTNGKCAYIQYPHTGFQSQIITSLNDKNADGSMAKIFFQCKNLGLSS